ncbi:MAG TPA: MOSC domain-containing protein [Roseovarius sp.]|nr:MOSC domain-containing protein [Roseovarius sp.]
MTAHVIAVAQDGTHRFSKTIVPEIRLLDGLGVEGDAHCGELVKHRSRVRVDPTQQNLRQVHLFQSELFEEFAEKGFLVAPADLGENITTQGIDLLDLPRDTVLRIGETAKIKITGFRNPCAQIDAFLPGLLSAVLIRKPKELIRRTGIMGVVVDGGLIRAGDEIVVHLPAEPHKALERV